MTAEHPPTTTVVGAAVEPPADPRPAWERVAYTWLEREVDGGHQVNPTAPAAEVSVSPRLASELVRVLRAQRQRDPALAELRGRLVRDKITDAYLVRELRGGATLDAAELARQVGTTTKVARQWLHTLRAVRSGDPRLALLRAQPASHGQPSQGQLAALQAAYAGGGRPDPEVMPVAGSALERIEQAWRTREIGHGEHLDPVQLAREVGVGRAYTSQTLAALRGGELTNTHGSPSSGRWPSATAASTWTPQRSPGCLASPPAGSARCWGRCAPSSARPPTSTPPKPNGCR